MNTTTLTLLDQLVNIKTNTGNAEAAKQAFDVIEARLKKTGMHIYRTNYDGFEALAATTKPTKNPKVMLAGHIDVVKAPNDMFKIKIEDDKIIGRGVWDMKSAIAGYILATEELKNSLTDYDFGIMISSDEEGPDLGIKKLIEEGYYPTETAVLFDGAENWQLEKIAKGAVGLKFTITDKSGHGSRPWLVNSSSMRMIDFLSELKSFFNEAGPLTNTVNVSALEAGVIGKDYNQIPAKTTATIDYRAINKDSRQSIQAKIDELCEKYSVEQEVLVEFPVLEHDESEAHYQAFADSVKKITGIQNKGWVSSGASSAGHFAKKGISCIVTWPTGGGHHSDNEWISVKALDEITPVLVDYLQKMAKV